MWRVCNKRRRCGGCVMRGGGVEVWRVCNERRRCGGCVTREGGVEDV